MFVLHSFVDKLCIYELFEMLEVYYPLITYYNEVLVLCMSVTPCYLCCYLMKTTFSPNGMDDLLLKQ